MTCPIYLSTFEKATILRYSSLRLVNGPFTIKYAFVLSLFEEGGKKYINQMKV